MARRATDDGILRTAAAILAEGGAEALTMDGLAAEVGLSRTTLHRRFGGRAGILARLSELGVDAASEGPDVEARILASARKSFTAQGFAEATVEAIAAGAGVSPATVYRRFGDKDGLIVRFLATTRQSQEWPDLDALGGDLDAEMRALTRALLKRLHANRDLTTLFMSVSRIGRELADRVRMSPGRTHPRVEAFMAERVADGRLVGGSPAQLAHAYFGMLFAFGVLAPVMAPHALTDDMDETVDFIVALFLRGARGPGVNATAAQGVTP